MAAELLVELLPVQVRLVAERLEGLRQARDLPEGLVLGHGVDRFGCALEAELERTVDGDGPVGEVAIGELLHRHFDLIILTLGPGEGAHDRFAVLLGELDALGTDRLAEL